MSNEKTFTKAEIEEAVEYLVSLGFTRPLDREIEGQILFTLELIYTLQSSEHS